VVRDHHELVWDNYNFFVIGYSPNRTAVGLHCFDRRSGKRVGLCFIRGASLPDPKKLLLGSGNQTRFIRLESAAVLARLEVEALIATAIARAKTPLAETGRSKLIIRSVSAKQRPRRKGLSGQSTPQRRLTTVRPLLAPASDDPGDGSSMDSGLRADGCGRPICVRGSAHVISIAVAVAQAPGE
jgi:hypothetical protein